MEFCVVVERRQRGLFTAADIEAVAPSLHGLGGGVTEGRRLADLAAGARAVAAGFEGALVFGREARQVDIADLANASTRRAGTRRQRQQGHDHGHFDMTQYRIRSPRL